MPGLAAVFGIEPGVKVQVQPGRYHVRGALNGMTYLDQVAMADNLPSLAGWRGAGGERVQASAQVGLPSPVRGRGVGGEGSLRAPTRFGVLGAKVTFKPAGGQVIGTFNDGSPAAVANKLGRGQAVYVGACPAISYIKDAKFVPAELKERWPAAQRRFINSAARRRGVPRLVELSHPVVEAGVYDAPAGSALVLANFTYASVDKLQVRLCVATRPKAVHSVEQGPLRFTAEPAAPGSHAAGFPHRVTFTLKLGTNDVVLIE